MKNKKICFYFFIIILTGLSGCMNAAMSGAQVVYDHHNLQKTLNDQYITMRANRAIYLNTDKYKDTNVSFSAFNNVVVLTGQVATKQQQKEIEQIVRKIPHVKELHNLTIVSNPVSTLTHISDSWITTKIKAKFIAANEIDPSQIKVITEDGNVYLMGIVPPEQANAAVQIARTTAGVQKVIKIFSYLRISKT